jgi:retron-type reverse transcriptase
VHLGRLCFDNGTGPEGYEKSGESFCNGINHQQLLSKYTTTVAGALQMQDVKRMI